MKDIVGRQLLQMRISAVLPHLHGRVLDIGCGTNELLRAYTANRGVGVDVYPWPGADLVVKDTSQLPFQAGEFDTVTIIAALNHIPNRQAVLAEAARVTREGGRLILTMIPPRISRVWHFLRSPWDADQKERGMIEGEVYGLSRREITGLLQAAGYSVASEHRFMVGVNCVTVARKVGRGGAA